MIETFKQCLWKNFGAAMDMLKNAIIACPEELWHREKKFYYPTYHTEIFLDYYLTIPVRDFRPTLPYTIIQENELPEGSVDDVIPDKYYSKEEMLTWLFSIRVKCKALITQATEDKLTSGWIEKDAINMHGLCPSTVVNYTVLEILFYNLRHVQHHAAQLNFVLRQQTGTAPDWVSLVDE